MGVPASNCHAQGEGGGGVSDQGRCYFFSDGMCTQFLPDRYTEAIDRIRELERSGYILAMRIMQSDLHLEDDEWDAVDVFLPKREECE